jgi:carboxymethylenebutenolidase
MTEVKESSIELKLSDDSEMQVFVCKPKITDRAPAILVLQEAFGVNSHIREIAKRLAQQGFLTACPELFHRTAPKGWEGSYEDFGAIAPHFNAVNRSTLEIDLQATFDWVRKQPEVDADKIACIGFCLGGRATFLANALLPLRAAASYYGGRIAPDYLSAAETQKAPILFFWGGLDKHIGPDQQRAVADAMRAAKKPFVEVEFSDADHGFMCGDRKSYNEKAAKQAWTIMLSFFQEYLTR